MELGWGGFDRAKLDMLILIRIPFSFHAYYYLFGLCICLCILRIWYIEYIFRIHVNKLKGRNITAWSLNNDGHIINLTFIRY